MRVLFLKEVSGTAKADDVKEVANGYARNYLFPQKLAVVANDVMIEQVKARKGPIIALTSGDGTKQLKGIANDIIEIPSAPEFATPVLTAIPLQLFAYHVAVELGRDVDKPRNLAKSVTVE